MCDVELDATMVGAEKDRDVRCSGGRPPPFLRPEESVVRGMDLLQTTHVHRPLPEQEEHFATHHEVGQSPDVESHYMKLEHNAFDTGR